MKPIDLYMMHVSAPCRSVWMVMKELGLEVNVKVVDLMKGEHYTPEYTKMNPQNMIPTIDDNGSIFYESRSIMLYLAEKYSKKDSFYPKDLVKRTAVHRFLFFDLDKMYGKIGPYIYPKMLSGVELDPEKDAIMKKSLDSLDMYLNGKKFLTGDNLCVADLNISASVMMTELVDYDLSPWKNVSKWMKEMKSLPYFAECNKGIYDWKEFMKTRTEKDLMPLH